MLIYTDLAEAFDYVYINRLLWKLERIGIFNSLLGRLRSYLTGRKQSVKVNNAFSITNFCVHLAFLSVLILGQFYFLFLLTISKTFLLFADDLKLFRTVDSIYDNEYLPHDLGFFTIWCKYK